MQPRLAALPREHLLAEIAAWPLSSVGAFRLGLTRLGPSREGTDDAWRGFEPELTAAFPAHSLDELVTLRDLTWFGANAERREVSLAQYLRRLGREWLEATGASAKPCRTASGRSRDPRVRPAAARMAHRWMRLALPADLLAAAVMPTGAIDGLAPSVRRLLRDEGFAETHLHFGAGLDFPTAWVGVMRSVLGHDISAGAFKSPGAAFDDGADWTHWLARTAIVRHVLALFLTAAGNRLFEDWVFGTLRPACTSELGPAEWQRLYRTLNELGTGRLANRSGLELRMVQALGRGIAGLEPASGQAKAGDAAAMDPIAALLGPGGAGAFGPEVRLVRLALAHMDRHRGDRLFARMFWQVVRLRAAFHRHVVHRPMTPGLQRFVRTYDRIDPATKSLSKGVLMGEAVHVAGLSAGLRSAELRTSPGASGNDVRRKAQALHGAWLDLRSTAPDLELGLVLHLARSRGGGWCRGTPAPHWADTSASPGTRAGRSTVLNPNRYSSEYRRLRREAFAFGRCLIDFPASLRYLRGLDACTDEAGVPTWVLAPLFRYVRECAGVAAATLAATGDVDPPRFHVTVHAGEDFEHLQTGLRRLWEAVRWFGLGEGDRIGHGLALAVDARTWAERAGTVAMAAEEYLLDLAWEAEFLLSQPEDGEQARIGVLRSQVADLANDIFETTSMTLETVRGLYGDLHDETTLGRSGFPDAFPGRSPLAGYLSSQRLFRRGRRIIEIDVAQEGARLLRLQAALRREVAERSLVVEINPTSNMLIGHQGDIRSSPTWRLNPPRPDPELPPVRTCIGSDDPLTFASSLPEEYQLVADAATLAGVCDSDVSRWLEELRATGMSARFTLPSPHPGGPGAWISSAQLPAAPP